ncbi:MAG: hypothetical protein QG597_5109 [Actinomycetota bacterium]|nr:hypothetical protein [Actinomycetota bacterium]
MGQLGSWLTRIGVGFARACIVVAVTMPVPAVWTAAAALWIWWGRGWTAIGPVIWASIGTLAVSPLVCRMVRSLVERWIGTVIPIGYRRPAPVVRMSTGYWWNGHSYHRTRRDALHDQWWRIRWRDPAAWRDLRFAVTVPVTVGAVAAIPPAGVAVAVFGVFQPTPAARLVGVLGAVVAVVGAPYAWRPLGTVAVRLLCPPPTAALADRVDELTAQRADATVAQAAEIRRIERDLHDGAQARLVALGLSLATMERLLATDPDQARALLRKARAGAKASLAELRELVRGISPPVLNERGLVDAVHALALDVPLGISVDANLSLRLDAPIESALYFGVAELLTNAVKHARASQARITIRCDDTCLTVEVSDDGRGGARAADGGGLAGLRNRLGYFDGTLTITSPSGGPTRVTMAVPCESS